MFIRMQQPDSPEIHVEDFMLTLAALRDGMLVTVGPAGDQREDSSTVVTRVQDFTVVDRSAGSTMEHRRRVIEECVEETGFLLVAGGFRGGIATLFDRPLLAVLDEELLPHRKTDRLFDEQLLAGAVDSVRLPMTGNEPDSRIGTLEWACMSEVLYEEVVRVFREDRIHDVRFGTTLLQSGATGVIHAGDKDSSWSPKVTTVRTQLLRRE
ncbi:MAG: hypothetical protein ACOC2Y_06625 [Spirochaetota bacterium]